MIHYLRKHSKIILVVAGIVAMITFIFGGALSNYSDRNHQGQINDPVKVSWRGGQLRESELHHLKVVHAAAVRFVNLVIQKARENKGQPRAPGYPFIVPQEGYIGISPNADDGSLVETLLLAQQGREMGVRVDDEAVKIFLQKLGDYTLDDADLNELMESSMPDRRDISAGVLFEHLKTELLAQETRLMLKAGIEGFTPGDIAPHRMMTGENGLVPPGEMWQAYEKLNRRATIEAYPFHVKDFVSQVQGDPSEEELQKLFKEGRTRLPNPAFEYPGFMQTHKVAFEYIKGDLAPFLEAAKKEVTTEQIAKAYEEGKAKGEFKVPEPPPMKPEVKPGETPVDPAAPKEPTGDKPGEKPATEKPAEKKEEKPAPGETKPEEKKPEEKKPEEKKPADTKPADKKPESKPEPKKNQGSAIARDVQLVNFQNDDTKKAATKQPTTKQPATKPPASKPADKKPADKKPGETKPADPKPADTKPADPKPAETKPGETKPAETKPGETPPADPAVTPAEKPAEKEVKFKPLSEVEDEIRTTIARPIASERRTAVVTKVIDAVNNYGRKYSRWKFSDDRAKKRAASKDNKDSSAAAPVNNSGPAIEKPEPLNLKEILGDTGLKLDVIPLVDTFEVREEVDKPQAEGEAKKVPKYEIAKSFLFDFSRGGLRPFSEVAFAQNDSLYSAQTLPFPWENRQFMGGGGTEIWIYWRTDEQLPKEREFSAARKDVLAYWKELKALELAKAAAKDLADKAAMGKDLKSLVTKKEELVTPPAFSWFSVGAIGGQNSQPSMTEIAGIRFAGEDFRQSVFDLSVGQAGTALDQPHKTVWAVKLLSEDGLTDADRIRFLEKGTDNELVGVAWQSQMSLQQDLYSEFIKSFQVNWTPKTGDESNE